MSSRNLFFNRYKGDVDELGFDVEPYEGVEPYIRLMYDHWFKVQFKGKENIPAAGNAILFGNHGGTLPVDGLLLYDGIINHHHAPRRVRFLVTKFLHRSPVIGKLLRGFGCIVPDLDLATELLRKQELVYFYPEAEKGTGKLFKDRYKLVEFHAGFVRAAIKTQSPLVPVITIGSDEIYPLLAKLKSVAKLFHAPYLPITPFFPIPLPVKVLISVWPSFKLRYAPEDADNDALVDEIANDIRQEAQARVNDLLAIRTSPFASWNINAVNEYLSKTNYCSSRMDKHLSSVATEAF